MKEFVISEAKVETAVLVGLITLVSYTHLDVYKRQDSDQEEAVIRLCVPSKLFSLVRIGLSKVTSKDSTTILTTIF